MPRLTAGDVMRRANETKQTKEDARIWDSFPHGRDADVWKDQLPGNRSWQLDDLIREGGLNKIKPHCEDIFHMIMEADYPGFKYEGKPPHFEYDSKGKPTTFNYIKPGSKKWKQIEKQLAEHEKRFQAMKAAKKAMKAVKVSKKPAKAKAVVKKAMKGNK